MLIFCKNIFDQIENDKFLLEFWIKFCVYFSLTGRKWELFLMSRAEAM